MRVQYETYRILVLLVKIFGICSVCFYTMKFITKNTLETKSTAIILEDSLCYRIIKQFKLKNNENNTWHT